ncbi:DUF294 nucleotidyltransferase-like domain-containing protein [Tistrella bauzanensis]|uniref:DUF294 nucleotidyltransferase-like domain-containing protein n=1 Tax=Tistrella TaxID=171436 RepID=UPI0031F671A1
MEPSQAEALFRLDSYPYRHRAGDVANRPLVTAAPAISLRAAAAVMADAGVSALVATDVLGRPEGILTERDLVRAMARDGAAAADADAAALMSRPVQTIEEGAFVYVAIGRMRRFRIRHLVVVDQMGRAVGMITRRSLLRLRAGDALAMGDRAAAAEDAAGLASVRADLAPLAGSLLDQAVDARAIAAVISAVTRDLTARAAGIAEASMLADGAGPAPAAYTVLVLGSAGRGEALLVPDQDNALIHAGRESDDPWFAELGRRMCRLLNDAGIPFCQGGVMASNAAWRHAAEDWRDRVRDWIAHPEGDNMLNADIFFDMMPVFGDKVLGVDLKAFALNHARHAPHFLHAMTRDLDDMHAPIGLFGDIRTDGRGKLDLKRHGLLPLTLAARALALRQGIALTGTAERLAALGQAGLLNPTDARQIDEAHALVMALMLDAQVARIKAGKVPETSVVVSGLDPHRRGLLKTALKRIDAMVWVMRSSVTA